MIHMVMSWNTYTDPGVFERLLRGDALGGINS